MSNQRERDIYILIEFSELGENALLGSSITVIIAILHAYILMSDRGSHAVISRSLFRGSFIPQAIKGERRLRNLKAKPRETKLDTPQPYLHERLSQIRAGRLKNLRGLRSQFFLPSDGKFVWISRTFKNDNNGVAMSGGKKKWLRENKHTASLNCFFFFFLGNVEYNNSLNHAGILTMWKIVLGLAWREYTYSYL